MDDLLNKRTNQYDIIPEVVDYIINKINPNKIILFGSCARGIINIDSDIDLCIVLEEGLNLKERCKLRVELLKDIINITEYEIDLYICSKEQWLEQYEDRGTFIGKINSEGKILYGR